MTLERLLKNASDLIMSYRGFGHALSKLHENINGNQMYTGNASQSCGQSCSPVAISGKGR
jgi:hypothetical protein